jgi:hypothetical protein
MLEQEIPIVKRMTTLVDQWEAARDRRAIFLGCYRLMTLNMLDAIDAGRFHDGVWVSDLLQHFTDYYFNALALYEQSDVATPPVWQLAHDATRDEAVTTLQHLLLGVNAHINFDLVFTLVDQLTPEWADLSLERREQRHADHELVNRIIGETVDAVQDEVIDRHSPWFEFVDKMLGPVDEWLTSHLIAHWREEVWSHAVRYLELTSPEERADLHRQIEHRALQLGTDFLKIRS